MPQPATPDSYAPNPHVRYSLTPSQTQPLQVHSLGDCLGRHVSEVGPVGQVNLQQARAVESESGEPHVREEPAPGEVNGAQGSPPSEREGREGEIVDRGT